MGRSLDLVPASVEDFRLIAERRLPRFLFDYIDGGSGSETTLRENVADFAALRLRQKVLAGLPEIDTSIELFGETLAMPLALAPVGLGGMTRRRGEVQAKRAADALGIPFTLSTVGICGIDEVAGVSPRPFWFQLYMLRDRGVVEEILDRAWEQGVRTLLFTVDLAVVGTRYRDIRNGMTGQGGLWGKLRSGAIDYALHPRWAWDVGMRGKPHTFGPIARFVPEASNPDGFRNWMDGQFDGSSGWKDIAWLRKVWRGNLVLKGILDPDDARQAVAIGADGMVVSNHGGRQLDGVVSGAAMLPRIADALGGSHPLLVDGGIRCGQDLVKARALGATAALIGRPWVYAIAAQGEAGLRRLLGLFKADMRTALALTGVANARDVGPDVLQKF